MRGKVVFLTNALASPPTSPALTPAGAARDLIAILVARPLKRIGPYGGFAVRGGWGAGGFTPPLSESSVPNFVPLLHHCRYYRVTTQHPRQDRENARLART